MDVSVVLLEYRGGYTFEILSSPINFKAPGDSIHESLLAFEHLQGAGNSSHRKKCRKRRAGGRVRIRQPLPIGKPSCTSHPQGIEGGAADGDCVCGLVCVKSECFGDSCCDRVRTLCCVVEPCRSDRSDLAESALHLIGHS